MWNSGGFRLPDGAKLVGRHGDEFRMQISIPLDEDGFLGRHCPDCSQTFRVDASAYEALPDDVRLWCVYCGHHDDHSEFMTTQQRDRALRAEPSPIGLHGPDSMRHRQENGSDGPD